MTSKVSRHVEDYIDEQCRILNKNGTPHGSALHLAQWMKGQFDDSVNTYVYIIFFFLILNSNQQFLYSIVDKKINRFS